jgi:UDP-2,4-diacetamido-2,4,6-trideoxy-beta-L-altropyranose hydrolase
MQQMEYLGFTLRPVQVDDCRLIWVWANDPTTRAASFSSEPILWEQHAAWFIAKLADPRSLFYIALDARSVPVGQIRYDIEGAEAVVSVGLAPDWRGRGYGNVIIRLGSQRVFENTSVSLVHAYVKPDNVSSAHVFAQAGFINSGLTEIKGHPALHFILTKRILP